MKARGFTLIEVLTALVILIGLGTVLWVSLRRGFAFDQRMHSRQITFEVLTSEAERLHGRPQTALHDSVYELPLDAGKKIKIKRSVLDSAWREKWIDPLSLTPQVTQAWQRRPLEVVLEAWPENDTAQSEDFGAEALEKNSSPADSANSMRLFLVLPDYQWY